MKSVARGNRVVFGLIIVSLVGFSAYCWQLLSQQQRAFDLSVAAAFYLVMTLVLTWGFQRLEKRYAKHDE